MNRRALLTVIAFAAMALTLRPTTSSGHRSREHYDGASLITPIPDFRVKMVGATVAAMGTLNGIIKGGAQLTADLRVSISCGSQRHNSRPRVSTLTQGSVSFTGSFSHRPSGAVEQTVTVPLASSAKLRQHCGGSYAARVVAHADCGPGGSTTRLKHEHLTTINIPVECDSRYLPAEATPIMWRHQCPTGFVIPDTGNRHVDKNNNAPVNCIKEGELKSTQRG